MDYKTILVHVDIGPDAPARIRLAIGLARRAGAHPVGAASTGNSRYVTTGMLAGADAANALQTFARLVREAGLHAAEARLVDDDVDGGMAMQARYRELLPGGVTATVLRALTLPFLLAH